MNHSESQREVGRPPSESHRIGRALEAMRAFSRRKVSQRALAKRLQVTEASISRYLNGTQSPSRDVVWEIEKAYGVRHGYVERIAGYVEDDNLGVTEAIFADERLNDGEKRMLAAAYASALAN